MQKTLFRLIIMWNTDENALNADLYFRVSGDVSEILGSKSVWFCQKNGGQINGRNQPSNMGWHGNGVQLIKDIQCATEENVVRTLKKGGALVRALDGQVWAVQPAFFRLAFSRCFSNGSEIVSLDCSEKEQLRALLDVNGKVGEKINTLAKTSGLKMFFNRKSITAKLHELAVMNDDIRHHLSAMEQRRLDLA